MLRSESRRSDDMHFRFEAPLWLYEGAGAWHFITVPTEIANVIREVRGPFARGFGSLRVSATVGQTRWNTSIFPDAKSGSCMLPVKKQVRVVERLAERDLVDVLLELTD